MKLIIKYRFTLQNVSGSNDCYLVGRVAATSLPLALRQALTLWSFNVPPLEASFEYCGVVEESPKDKITRVEFEED